MFDSHHLTVQGKTKSLGTLGSKNNNSPKKILVSKCITTEETTPRESPKLIRNN
jgi:hypothetical protein